MTTKAEIESCGHKPRDAGSHWQLEEERNRFYPKTFRGSVALPTHLPP